MRLADIRVPPANTSHGTRARQRAETTGRSGTIPAPLGSGGATLAGFTWSEDEPVNNCIRRGGAARTRVRIVIVPHEPTPENLERLEGMNCRRPSLRRLSAGGEPARLMWWIGRLWPKAVRGGQIESSVAGLGKAGLHSVLEPAAPGAVPVLFGPAGKAEGKRAALRAGPRRSVSGISPMDRLDALTTVRGASTLAAYGCDARNPAHASAAGPRTGIVEDGVGAAERKRPRRENEESGSVSARDHPFVGHRTRHAQHAWTLHHVGHGCGLI